MELTIFNYRGHKIRFKRNNNDDLMVSATDMSKPHMGKRPVEFLRNNQTQDFISVLGQSENLHFEDICKKERGGSNPGTWMHEKLALKFAAWLSPTFELWVYDRIHELLTTGQTQLSTAKNQFDVMRHTIDMLESQERRLSLVEAKITTKNEDFYTISGWANLNGLRVGRSQAQKLGKAAVRLSTEMNYPTDKEYDAKYGQINSYHCDILKIIFKSL